jgi:hypothetical protein
LPQGGTFTFESGAGTITVGTWNQTGGVMNLNAPTVVTGTTTLNLGTLVPNSSLSLQGFTWNGGQLIGTGTTTVNGATSIGGGSSGLALEGENLVLDGATTVSSGTGYVILLLGPTNNSSNITVNNSFTINGDWSLDSSTFAQSTLTIGSGGSLIKAAGTLSPGSVIAASVTNNGTIDVKAGMLNLAGQNGLTNAGTATVEAGTSLDVALPFVQTGGSTLVTGTLVPSSGLTLNGGTLTGAGTIQGNVSNAGGTVSPGSPIGVLTMTGTFTQGSGGKTSFEIGGTTLGTQFSELVVQGAATLAGTLNITLTNGFIPVSGNTFKVLTYSTHTGTFATVTGGSIGGGLALLPQYNSTNVDLYVGAKPVTYYVYLPNVDATVSLAGW